MTTLHQIRSIEKRKQVRELIARAVEGRKEQLAIFENSLFAYFKRIINKGNETLKSQESIEQFLYSNEKFSEWFNKFISTGNKIMSEEAK